MRYRWLRHGDNDEKVLKTYTSRPSKPGEPTMFLPRNGELDRLIDAARTVMLDQVSFDRKPDCYGIRQITDDDGVEEWVDIRTSPDVAREEANDMMATGRGEIYEVVPLWTTPQPTQPQARRDALEEAAAAVEKATPTPQADGQPAPDEIINMAREQGLPETEIEGVFRVNADDLCRVAAAILAARAPADSVLEDAAQRTNHAD